MKDLSIHAKLVKANQPIDNHHSDLYTPVNSTTERIVRKYQHRRNVETFRNTIDGGIWYDIPFAFDPYWSSRNG
jgi:hypothetical protein